MRQYLRVLKLIKPHIFTLSLAVVCMIGSAIFDGASLTMIVPLADKVLGHHRIIIARKLPDSLTHLVNGINNTPPLMMLNIIVIMIPIMFILKGIFFFARSFMIQKLSYLVVKDVRDKLYQKIQNFSLDYFAKDAVGRLVSRITYDADILKGTIAVGITDLFYQISTMGSFW